MRHELLESSFAPVKSSAAFRVKSTILSFSLAIPACKLYVWEMFKAIGAVAKNSKIAVPIQGPLRQVDFLGQLVWSYALAVGTSSLCLDVQRRLPERLASSLG